MNNDTLFNNTHIRLFVFCNISVTTKMEIVITIASDDRKKQGYKVIKKQTKIKATSTITLIQMVNEKIESNTQGEHTKAKTNEKLKILAKRKKNKDNTKTKEKG